MATIQPVILVGNNLIPASSTDQIDPTVLGTGPVTSGLVLTATSGTTAAWQTPTGGGGGVTLANDTTTNLSRYPMFADATSGTITTAYTSDINLYYNPLTGTLSAQTFTSLSDKNYKTNVKTLTSPMSTLSELRGVSFDWKKTGTSSYGVIAQEIEKILPELVHTSDYGVKSVDYQAIIPFLIETIKELDARVKELENK